MQLAIDQTRANGFEQLELGVYSDNSRAIPVSYTHLCRHRV